MRRLSIYILPILLLAGVAALVWWVLADQSLPAPEPQAQPVAQQTEPQALVADDPVAEADPEPEAWPDRAARTLKGKIVDLAGQPIVGARIRVIIEDKGDRYAQAKAKGRYQVGGVPADPARIEISATGFETFVDEAPKLPAQREIEIDYELSPKEGYRGIVQANGEPVSQAFVTVLPATGRRPLRVTRTDSAGRFWMPVVEVETLRIRGYHGQHGEGVIEVEAPDDEIVVDLLGGGYLEGYAVDENGQAVEAFSVSATPMIQGAGGPPAQSFDSTDGFFSLGPLAPGTVRVWAAAKGRQPTEIRNVEVISGETKEGIKLVLPGSTILMGRVIDASTRRPIEGAEVIPAEWRSRALAESVGGYTDADGRYRLDALPGVRTSVEVKAEGYRSLLLGGVEGRPGEKMVRDFALTPQTREGRPRSELTGIGAVLKNHRRGVSIMQVVPDGPASGVLSAGDVVVSVDGTNARTLGMRGVAQAIRGEEGTDVELQILRRGRGQPQRVTLERGRVTMPERRRRHN